MTPQPGVGFWTLVARLRVGSNSPDPGHRPERKRSLGLQPGAHTPGRRSYPVKLLSNGHFLINSSSDGQLATQPTALQEVDFGSNVIWQVTTRNSTPR